MNTGIMQVFKPKLKGAKAATTTPLVYSGGPLITNPQVQVIYLGSAWKKEAALTSHIESFFTAILSSSLMDQLAEYNTGPYKYGHGKLLGSTYIAHTFKGKKIDDSEIQTLLKSWIAAGTVPADTPQTLYFVYIPQNVKITSGTDASCTQFCGYHESIDKKVFYAVLAYPSCSGCLGGLSIPDAITVTSSHELCEAMTDAIPGSGWYNNAKGEDGDMCAWTFKDVAGFKVQQEWSNKLNGCL
jgi:hypothetical protein